MLEKKLKGIKISLISIAMSIYEKLCMSGGLKFEFEFKVISDNGNNTIQVDFTEMLIEEHNRDLFRIVTCLGQYSNVYLSRVGTDRSQYADLNELSCSNYAILFELSPPKNGESNFTFKECSKLIELLASKPTHYNSLLAMVRNFALKYLKTNTNLLEHTTA